MCDAWSYRFCGQTKQNRKKIARMFYAWLLLCKLRKIDLCPANEQFCIYTRCFFIPKFFFVFLISIGRTLNFACAKKKKKNRGKKSTNEQIMKKCQLLIPTNTIYLHLLNLLRTFTRSIIFNPEYLFSTRRTIENFTWNPITKFFLFKSKKRVSFNRLMIVNLLNPSSDSNEFFQQLLSVSSRNLKTRFVMPP